jgi:hypothetical protein
MDEGLFRDVLIPPFEEPGEDFSTGVGHFGSRIDRPKVFKSAEESPSEMPAPGMGQSQIQF